jgi:hypothetical protein
MGASSPKIMPLSPDSPAWMLPREAVRPGKPTLHGGGGVWGVQISILAHHTSSPIIFISQRSKGPPIHGRAALLSRVLAISDRSGSSGGCAQCVGVVGLTRIIRLHEEGDKINLEQTINIMRRPKGGAKLAAVV